MKISPQRPKIGFMFDYCVGDLLGFHAKTLNEEYNLSPNPVDVLSFDNNFLEECHVAPGIFKGKRSGIIHNFTKDVDTGYNFIEKFRGGVQMYMTDSKDFVSGISCKLKNESNELVSFNGQSITFRLSIKEVQVKLLIQV